MLLSSSRLVTMTVDSFTLCLAIAIGVGAALGIGAYLLVRQGGGEP